MGIGDWGLGIGPNPQSPIPNPQSPIPNALFFLKPNNIKIIIKYIFYKLHNKYKYYIKVKTLLYLMIFFFMFINYQKSYSN